MSEEKNVTVFHILGDRPKVVPSGEAEGIEIPAGWLIFNAPRPLRASYVEKVVREAMKIDEFDYPEVKEDVYLDWIGDFRRGVFYTAVNPNDGQRIEENRRLDGWVLEYHSEEEAVEWAVEFYGREYGSSEEYVRSHPDYCITAFFDHLNEGIR